MSEKSVSPSVHIRLVLTMLFWGGTFVAGRLFAEELHPQNAAAFRFMFSRGLGMMFSVTGALIVISRGQPAAYFSGNIGVGELCIVGCVLSWSAYTLIGKKMLSNISPLVVVAYSCSLGFLRSVSY